MASDLYSALDLRLRCGNGGLRSDDEIRGTPLSQRTILLIVEKSAITTAQSGAIGKGHSAFVLHDRCRDRRFDFRWRRLVDGSQPTERNSR
jgi:hypothetical protein